MRKTNRVNKSSDNGDRLALLEDNKQDKEVTRCSEELAKGVESIAGAARLSIAAVEDMLSGRLSPQQAAVINTASRSVIKACELHLKYGRSGSQELCLPAADEDKK